jgi:Tol biopolymer transport system component
MRRLLVLGLLLAFAVPASATTSRILAPMDWWPVWSPTGKQVAFTRIYPNRQELWVVTLAGGRGTKIGTSAGQLNPTWSADGTRLAYSSGGVVYTVDADGARKRRYDAAPARSFAPAWRPAGTDLAYLTTKGAQNTDLWVAGSLWARNAVGAPAWSPDGTQLAFQRDDGIYLADGSAQQRKLVAVSNPGPPAWSHDGGQVAYFARGKLYVVDVRGGPPVLKVAHVAASSRVPSWSLDDARVSGDRAWSPVAYASVAPGPKPGCPGHTVLMLRARALTGSCAVTGTAKGDVIEGTPLWGDVIVAGAGNDRVHANDRHTDRVDCGPGRDTVWADRTDRLSRCEIIHR